MKKEYYDRIEYTNEKGELHRLDGPAHSWKSGSSDSWYINGKLHREDDLPAIIFSDGTECWYINGKPHRETGPAIISNYERPEYYLEGIRYYNIEDFDKKLMEIKINRLIKL
jgi:hypothetical protein